MKDTELFSLGETFTKIDFLDDSASCWSIDSLEQKITRLFSLGETFANLQFVWFGSDRRGALVRSVCDIVCSTFKDIFGLTVLQGNQRFPCCPDSVSETLTGQAVVPPIASRSRGAGDTGPGAARGGLGEVRREAHPLSIPKQQRWTAGRLRLWHISCRRH